MTTTEAVTRLLIVDDDKEFVQLIDEFLSAEGGFAVTARHDGEAGVAAALDGPFDLIVLDVGMPRLNGFEALKQIRQQSTTPVIMLTARGDDIDRILGLEIGADDYVPKPCNLRELTARIRAIVRRAQTAQTVEETGLTVGDLRIEPSSHSVFCGDTLVTLTGAEFLVLEALVQAAGDVVDKNTIMRHAMGRRSAPYDRSVDVHVAHLRKKLGPLPNGQQRIKTVRGRGYLYAARS